MSNANFQCILVRIHGLSQWLKRSTSPSCAFFQHFSAAVGASGLTCWRGWKIIVKTNKWSWSSSYHFQKKKKHCILLSYSHTAKKCNIYIHIFTPPSVFTPTKSFQHATRKAGSITDQVKPSALANKALVGLPSFRHTSHLLSPTFIILDSIHLIIQDTILETLPFLLRVTRLSNANNRRPDVSSSLTSVVALPAGSCSLSVRIETWHCLGTEHRLKIQEFTNGLSGRWSALKGSIPILPQV